MIAKEPSRVYRLGDVLPSLPRKITSWPWGPSAALTAWASEQLHYPLGTILQDVVDGHPVIAQLQTHYGFGAHPEWADKAHKGTSVFVPSVEGKPLAVAPEGWGEGDAFAGEIGRTPIPRTKWGLLAGFTVGALAGGPLWAIVGLSVGLSADWLASRPRPSRP